MKYKTYEEEKGEEKWDLILKVNRRLFEEKKIKKRQTEMSLKIIIL